MRNNSSFYKPKKAVIIAKYQGPDIAHEQVLKNNVKCASIVENRDGKLARFEAQVNLNVGPIFGKVLWHQISNSAYFCVHFTTWLFYQWRRIEERKDGLSCSFHHVIDLGKACSLHIQAGKQMQNNNSAVCKIHARINIKPLTCLCMEPDLRWCKRLLVDLVEYMQLQDVMAWLSTLGGAYSAMGDHLYSYSEKAGQISQHQFIVATRLGNPVLAAQCKVFAALSLMQQGKLKLASRIIREQYFLAVSNGFGKDEKLISSCKATWYRIQYLKKQQKINKQAHGIT
ncbi:hypothetical protein OS493_007876 [Desmophyllum pertusum]|uniref:Uncharacterized protein n=1 Tax=Desmophyllum pertusum TaxID=174260 RepID=A0A9W9YI22_9CNID|nr:hypothetical protein OS493_007876 [Desmophyllum pertusum]